MDKDKWPDMPAMRPIRTEREVKLEAAVARAIEALRSNQTALASNILNQSLEVEYEVSP